MATPEETAALAAALRGQRPTSQDMGVYGLITASDEDNARMQAAAMAQALRGQRAAGNLGLLTGDRVLSGFGQAQLQGAGQQENLLAEAGQQRANQVLKQALATKEAERQAKIDAEQERHHRALENRPPSNVYLPGPGGQYFVMPDRGPVAATGVVDESGNPVARPEPPKQISAAEKDTLQELTADARAFHDLGARFKDEYAGGGALGGLRTAAASAAGSWAPEKEQETVSFWADFARLIDLPQRNRVFGASLSPGEKASWESAKNIKRGSDPALVRRTFQELGAIADRKVEERAQALLAEGYKPDAVGALTGRGATAAQPATSGAPKRTPMPSGELGGGPPSPAAAPPASAVGGIVTEAMGRGFRPLNMGMKPFTMDTSALTPKQGGIFMFNPDGAAFFVKDAFIKKARDKGWKDAK